MELNELWAAVKTEVAQHVPEAVASLQPGCAPEALTQAETLIGQPLPGDLQTLYTLNNGQPEHTISGLFYGMEFMAVERSTDWIQGIQAWHEEDPELAGELFGHSFPAGAVRSLVSHPLWWPFASDGGGVYLAVDLAPGPTGKTGQVINYGSGQAEKYVIAENVTAFLGWYLRTLRSGNVHVNRASYLTQPRLELARPRREMFPDALKALYRAGEFS